MTSPNVWKLLVFALAVGVIFFQAIFIFTSESAAIRGGTPETRKKGDTVFLFENSMKRHQSLTKSRAGDVNKFWIETISLEPKVFILHNLATKEECEHLIELGKQKGMQRAKILPYGQTELVESSVRTNTGAWLDFQQDDVVMRIENKMAEVTRTTPEHGESIQILHYEPGQQFTEHHDFFDPETDPPENFEPGGNRMATIVLYLNHPTQGGETYFTTADIKVLPNIGDAVLFYDLKPDGSVDRLSMHAGMPPIEGEKWVASKWIHQAQYQFPRSSTTAAAAIEEEEVAV